MRARKRRLSRSKQFRNLGYLILIAMSLLAAVVTDRWYAWALFACTAYEFWPAGHYGQKGVH